MVDLRAQPQALTRENMRQQLQEGWDSAKDYQVLESDNTEMLAMAALGYRAAIMGMARVFDIPLDTKD